MLTLENIIKQEFQLVNLDEQIEKLAAHKLYEFLHDAISLLNGHIENKEEELKEFGELQVSSIACSLLVKINEYFRQLVAEGKESEKEELEYLLGNITKRILKTIIDEVPNSNKAYQFKSIEIALRDTCTLMKYDFGKLSEFIQIDDLVREIYVNLQSPKPIEETIDMAVVNGLPFFCCCNSFTVDKLQKLIDIIVELGICKEQDKLMSLFNQPKVNLAIRFNEERADYVMQFWVALYESKFIESSHAKIGYYQVLEAHVLNFKDAFLKGKSGQRGADRVRKLKSWYKRREDFDKYFKQLI